MWRLLTSNGRFLSIASLPATLGSEADNDLRLRHGSIEARHARFREGPDGRLAVEALGDAVVGVDGRKVERGTLGHGEQLILGSLSFTVERVAGSPPGPKRPTGKTPASPATAPVAKPAAARRPAPAAVASAQGADELITVRDKTLRTRRKPVKRGALNVDFAQLSGAWKAGVVLALLLLGAGLLWGVSLLTGLMG